MREVKETLTTLAEVPVGALFRFSKHPTVYRKLSADNKDNNVEVVEGDGTGGAYDMGFDWNDEPAYLLTEEEEGKEQRVLKENVWDLLSKIRDVHGNLLLYGPPGVGKTRYGFECAKPGQEVFTLTCHDEMSFGEIWGFEVPDGKGSTKWKPGPGLLAWERAGVLVLNEVDETGDSALISMHALLDDRELAKITLSDGRTVKPKEGFRCVGTMNGTPDDLREAILDRFSMRVEVTRPSPEALDALGDKVLAMATARVYMTPDDLLFTYREAAQFKRLQDKVTAQEAATLVWGKRGGVVLSHLEAVKLSEPGAGA